MTARSDLGMQAINTIADLWQIDDSQIIWLDNGFDWWPGHYKQSLRVSEPIEHMDTEGFRISAVTEVLRDASKQ
jgi:hypothetical protein